MLEGVDLLAVLRQRARAVGARAREIMLEEFIAIGRQPVLAGRTMAAGIGGHDDMVPGRDFGHRRADPLDDASALMTEHHRMGDRIDRMVAHRHVGVADAGRDQAHDDLVGARRLHRQRFEREGRVLGARDGSGDLHGFLRCGEAPVRAAARRSMIDTREARGAL